VIPGYIEKELKKTERWASLKRSLGNNEDAILAELKIIGLSVVFLVMPKKIVPKKK
jgi:hypothetical protein